MENFETLEHDAAIDRFMKLKDCKFLTEDFAIAMFYKGISGDYIRGRQTLMSYIYLKHLPEHKFTGDDICEICGLKINEIINKETILKTYYLGHSWNELPSHYLFELEEIINKEKPIINELDKNLLDNLLELINMADKDETPGKLEKRISGNKILRKTDKYKRYGILQTLAECGILPNKLITPRYEHFVNFKEMIELHKNLKGSIRSDIILPLAGWRGEYGVNYKKYKEIFK
jgi:integrase